MYDQLWVQTQCCKQELVTGTLVTGTQRIAVVSHKNFSAGPSLAAAIDLAYQTSQHGQEQSFVQYQSWQCVISGLGRTVEYPQTQTPKQ